MTYAGADSALGIACESATPSEAKQTTPSATNTASASQSCGQSTPNSTLPETITTASWSATLVTAPAATPAR